MKFKILILLTFVFLFSTSSILAQEGSKPIGCRDDLQPKDTYSPNKDGNNPATGGVIGVDYGTGEILISDSCNGQNLIEVFCDEQKTGYKIQEYQCLGEEGPKKCQTRIDNDLEVGYCYPAKKVGEETYYPGESKPPETAGTSTGTNAVYTCTGNTKLKIIDGEPYCISEPTEKPTELPQSECFIENEKICGADNKILQCQNGKLKEIQVCGDNSYCDVGKCVEKSKVPAKINLPEMVAPTFPQTKELEKPQPEETFWSAFSTILTQPTIFAETGDTGFFGLLNQPLALVNNLFGGIPILFSSNANRQCSGWTFPTCSVGQYTCSNAWVSSEYKKWKCVDKSSYSYFPGKYGIDWEAIKYYPENSNPTFWHPGTCANPGVCLNSDPSGTTSSSGTSTGPVSTGPTTSGGFTGGSGVIPTNGCTVPGVDASRETATPGAGTSVSVNDFYCKEFFQTNVLDSTGTKFREALVHEYYQCQEDTTWNKWETFEKSKHYDLFSGSCIGSSPNARDQNGNSLRGEPLTRESRTSTGTSGGFTGGSGTGTTTTPSANYCFICYRNSYYYNPPKSDYRIAEIVNAVNSNTANLPSGFECQFTPKTNQVADNLLVYKHNGACTSEELSKPLIGISTQHPKGEQISGHTNIESGTTIRKWYPL